MNARGRHYILRAKYGVGNWLTYNEALQNRGSLAIWMSPEGAGRWARAETDDAGGQTIYFDLAIVMMLSLRVVLVLPCGKPGVC